MCPCTHVQFILCERVTERVSGLFRPVERAFPVRSSYPLSSDSEINSSVGQPKKRRALRPRTADGRDREADYASSGDELDDDDFSRCMIL